MHRLGPLHKTLDAALAAVEILFLGGTIPAMRCDVPAPCAAGPTAEHGEAAEDGEVGERLIRPPGRKSPRSLPIVPDGVNAHSG